jgi:hypothetical protein
VVWYFPITPRLQRYFENLKEAKLMHWHAERTKPEDDDAPEKEVRLCNIPIFGKDYIKIFT